MARGFEIVIDAKRKHPDKEITLPQRGSKFAVAYDIYSPVDVVIKPMEKQLIWTDVKAYFGENEALLINVRSSMGKQPVIIANSQGWVECDYYSNPDNDGNLGVNLFNLGTLCYQGRRPHCTVYVYKLSYCGQRQHRRTAHRRLWLDK